MEFSFSGVSVAQGQAGFCHPVPGVPRLSALRGRTCALNGTVLVLISANAVSGYLPSARHYRPESESETSQNPVSGQLRGRWGLRAAGSNLSFVRVSDDPL